MFEPAVLESVVDRLVDLSAGGPALELAMGTGRVGVPLLRRGVPVTGIELSPPMVDVLRRRAGAEELPVVVGDMAQATATGEFALVYLVFNALGNLRTQTEQVACFRNAARHLAPGGAFVVENDVPALRLLPPGATGVPFDLSPEHTGFDTFDTVTHEATSHHLTRESDGRYRHGVHHFRYVWPAECDLMAQLAGLTLESRWADWAWAEFTADSTSHVSVWRLLTSA